MSYKGESPKGTTAVPLVATNVVVTSTSLHDIVAEMEVTYNARREIYCNVTGALTPTTISSDATRCASEDDRASTDKARTPEETIPDDKANYYERIKGTIPVQDGSVRETKEAQKKRKRRTTARVHNPATDDITHVSTPAANEDDKGSTTNETSTKDDKANHAHNANRLIAPDDVSCDAPPSGYEHDKASTTNESSTEDPQTETYNPADYYEWEGQWYKLNEQE